MRVRINRGFTITGLVMALGVTGVLILIITAIMNSQWMSARYMG